MMIKTGFQESRFDSDRMFIDVVLELICMLL